MLLATIVWHTANSQYDNIFFLLFLCQYISVITHTSDSKLNLLYMSVAVI